MKFFKTDPSLKKIKGYPKGRPNLDFRRQEGETHLKGKQINTLVKGRRVSLKKRDFAKKKKQH